MEETPNYGWFYSHWPKDGQRSLCPVGTCVNSGATAACRILLMSFAAENRKWQNVVAA